MHIIYDIKSKIASELAGFGFDSSSWQLNLSTAQNVFSKFRPGWWQFCWMTGVKFNSIQSILVRFLHITQFTVCAAKNLTVFVADLPRCLEWSSMVVAVSRALRELSEPCLGWTRESRRQPKSLGARRQYSQATGNNVLPVMTGSPAFLTRPPPANVTHPISSVKTHHPMCKAIRIFTWGHRYRNLHDQVHTSNLYLFTSLQFDISRSAVLISSPHLNLTPLAAFLRFCWARQKRIKAARGVRFKSGCARQKRKKAGGDRFKSGQITCWLHKTKRFVLVVWSADHSTTGKFWVYNGNNKDQIQLEYIEDIQTSSLEAFSIRQTDKYKDQERNNCFSLHRRHFGQ